MKKITLLIVLVLTCLSGYAQTAAQYGFTATTGTYTELSAPTALGISSANTGAFSLNNINYSINFPDGFSFKYLGTDQTKLNVNTNGYVGFSSAAWTTSTTTPLNSNPSGGTTTGIISAFGASLNAYSIVTTAPGSISWQVEGTGTNEVLVVQYKNFKQNKDSNVVTRLLNFQIRIYESTHSTKPNYIELVYGNNVISDSSLTGVDVGIRGELGWAANVNSIMTDNVPAGTVCNWLNAVTANNATNGGYFNSPNTAVSIPNGLTYTFYPQSRFAPSPVREFVVPTVTATTATISWTQGVFATKYNVQYRLTDACDWTNFTGNPITSPTVTLTGLLPLKSYQVRVQSSDGTLNSIWSHIPGPTAGSNGYTAAGTFTTLATCLPPTAITVTNLTINSATLGWTSSVSTPGSGYEYYYSTSNTAPTATTTPSGSASAGNTATLTGLTSGTVYYVWVRSNCGGGTLSNWSAMNTFTTVCEPVAIPYAENFETATSPAIPTCTSKENTAQSGTWITENPGGDFSGKVLRYDYQIFPADAWFYTKALTLTAGTSYRLTYKYSGRSGESERLKVAFGTTNNKAAMVNELTNHTDITSEDVVVSTVDFTPTTTGVYYIGFNAYSEGNRAGIYVDDITVEVSPACTLPSLVAASTITKNSAVLTWKAPTTAPTGGYQYYVDTTSENPTSSSVESDNVGAGIVTKTLTNLEPSTEYYVWVRSNCGSGSYSDWTGPIKFTTQCNYGDVITTTPASVCGQGLVTLQATGSDGSILKWYTAATDGNQVGQGPSMTAYISATTTYYVAAANQLPDSDEFCEGVRVPVVATVTPATPITATTANVDICKGGSTTISATSTNTNYTYTWYPGNLQGPSQTVSPAQTTTYNVMGIDATSNCTTTATVTVKVNLMPSDITFTPAAQEVCGNNIQALTVNGGSTGSEGTVGTGTDLSGDYEQPTAFSNRWSNYWEQTIFTAAELTAAGLKQGDIASIAFNVATLGSAATNPEYTVKIGNTTLSSFDNNEYLPTNDFKTVYGPKTYTHTDSGWQVVTFDEPYMWDGLSNIVVNITYKGADQSTNTQTYYTETTDDMSLWATGYDPTTIYGTRSKSRLNTKFAVSNSATVTWSPVANLYSDAAASIPYTAGTKTETVYFKSAVTGTTSYTATAVAGASCTTTGTVSVTVGTTTIAPTVAATQQLCDTNPLTVADLTANGTTIQWYDAVSGGTALDVTTLLTSGSTYYATQTLNGCESERVASVIQITTTPLPTVAQTQSLCASTATLGGLPATGTNIQWYALETGGTALAAATVPVDGTTYYASQTVNGCESRRAATTVQINTTALPVADAAQAFCNAATVANLKATGTAIQWFTTAKGGMPLTVVTPITDNTVYYVSQTINGCESERVAVTATFNNVPAPTGNATQTITAPSGKASIDDIEVTATGNVTWYASEADALLGKNPIVAGTMVNSGTYYATQTIDGCTSKTVFTVTLQIVLGVEDFTAHSLTYYPNPVNDVLNLSYNLGITSVAVVNMLGQQVMSIQAGNSAEAKVDMSALAQGAYLVNVISGTTIKTIKVLKK